MSVAQDRRLDPNTGIFVAQVCNGSSADLGGIKKDDIILHLDRKEVPRMKTLRSIMSQKAPGDQIVVDLDRAGKVIRLEFKATRYSLDGPFEEIDQEAEEKYRVFATREYQKWLASATKAGDASDK